MGIEERFDDTIKILCKEIRKIVPLIFEQQDQKSYNAEIIKKSNGEEYPISAVVWYYEPLSLPKIAHELYHVKTGLILGDISIMVPGPSNDYYTKKLLNHRFCQEMLNQTEHCIFYPYYKAHGYPAEEFYEVINPEPYFDILAEIEKKGIKRPDGKFVFQNVMDYLKLIVLFLFFPIDSRFSNQIRRLKHIDTDLFSIFKIFKNTITGLAIIPNNREILQTAYASLLTSIDDWSLKHEFDSLPFVSNLF